MDGDSFTGVFLPSSFIELSSHEYERSSRAFGLPTVTGPDRGHAFAGAFSVSARFYFFLLLPSRRTSSRRETSSRVLSRSGRECYRCAVRESGRTGGGRRRSSSWEKKKKCSLAYDFVGFQVKASAHYNNLTRFRNHTHRTPRVPNTHLLTGGDISHRFSRPARGNVKIVRGTLKNWTLRVKKVVAVVTV